MGPRPLGQRSEGLGIEPTPIPSNAANLTPWTKSKFLAVLRDHFRRTPVATHSPGQRHGPFESWRAEDPAVTVSDTHSLWRVAQGAESAEERLSKCSFTVLAARSSPMRSRAPHA